MTLGEFKKLLNNLTKDLPDDTKVIGRMNCEPKEYYTGDVDIMLEELQEDGSDCVTIDLEVGEIPGFNIKG